MESEGSPWEIVANTAGLCGQLGNPWFPTSFPPLEIPGRQLCPPTVVHGGQNGGIWVSVRFMKIPPSLWHPALLGDLDAAKRLDLTGKMEKTQAWVAAYAQHRNLLRRHLPSTSLYVATCGTFALRDTTVSSRVRTTQS